MTVELCYLDLLLSGAKTKRAHRYVCYQQQQGLKLSDKLDGVLLMPIKKQRKWERQIDGLD